MGNFFNQLLAPVGIKLFGGSDYSDNGQGDAAQAQQAQATPYYNFLNQSGKDLISGAMPNAQKWANPNVYGADTPGYYNNFADYAGIARNGQAAGDPYQLLPHQQEQFNQQQDQITQMHKGSLGRLKASLAARGLKQGDPGYEAAMQHLEDFHNNQLQTHQTDFMERARGQHEQSAQTLAQMLNQFGQQRFSNANQLLGEGANMIGQGTGGYQQNAALDNNIGQQARQEHAANNQFWQGVIGTAAGGGFGGNPFGLSQLRNPSQGGTATQSDTVQQPPMYDEAGTGQAPPNYFQPLSYNGFQPGGGGKGFGLPEFNTGFNTPGAGGGGPALTNSSMFSKMRFGSY